MAQYVADVLRGSGPLILRLLPGLPLRTLFVLALLLETAFLHAQ